MSHAFCLVTDASRKRLTPYCSLLPSPVLLVHIPLSAYDASLHRVLECVHFANTESPEFFGINSNSLEVVVFGDERMIEGAWRDTRDGHDGGVTMTEEPWRVFEIECALMDDKWKGECDLVGDKGPN